VPDVHGYQYDVTVVGKQRRHDGSVGKAAMVVVGSLVVVMVVKDTMVADIEAGVHDGNGRRVLHNVQFQN
jgi:hypothetical protein